MSVSTAIHAGDGAPAALLERLASILPRSALLVGDAIDPRYQEDRRGRYSARPRFIARPGTTEEVAACLAACNDFAQPLVVQGGRTGLSGGHRIADGEAVLSTERMSQLGAVQPLTRTVLASAGTPLQAVQEAAEAAGCQFGVDIGARGSATVGGNVATNAGGILGVVTQALLRLHPKPLDEANAFVAVPSVGAALALLKRLRGAVGPGLSAFHRPMRA